MLQGESDLKIAYHKSYETGSCQITTDNLDEGLELIKGIKQRFQLQDTQIQVTQKNGQVIIKFETSIEALILFNSELDAVLLLNQTNPES